MPQKPVVKVVSDGVVDSSQNFFMWNCIQCSRHSYFYQIGASVLPGDLLAIGLLDEVVSISYLYSIQQIAQYT